MLLLWGAEPPQLIVNVNVKVPTNYEPAGAPPYKPRTPIKVRKNKKKKELALVLNVFVVSHLL